MVPQPNELPKAKRPPSSEVGLSTGAAVGVGIGCTVAFIAIVTLVAFFLLRRRRQRNRHKRSAERVPLSGSPEPKPEPHSGPPASYPHPIAVVSGQQYTRAPGYELDATQPKLELYVDQHNTPGISAIRT
ncbi:hypothetical protein PG997_010936 [Apiospora hydei]|uniref:Uncharacterized protein n=1 Tax=Apiospora hydei TaxID=1337664 RepID=A0ABR1VHQ8_9PEZI